MKTTLEELRSYIYDSLDKIREMVKSPGRLNEYQMIDLEEGLDAFVEMLENG